ncbi:hypothetical protein KCP77_09700 [Salmonella enterica subsp. enterica]|nr:hypothetical protein KCP77_09700 [Salmonella enterica subsp. enterica]
MIFAPVGGDVTRVAMRAMLGSGRRFAAGRDRRRLLFVGSMRLTSLSCAGFG